MVLFRYFLDGSDCSRIKERKISEESEGYQPVGNVKPVTGGSDEGQRPSRGPAQEITSEHEKENVG